MKKEFIETTYKIAEEEAKKIGVEVLDVLYLTENKEKFLRIYIYKDTGITIDLCEKLHRAIDPEIDLMDIDVPFKLEVCSPGYAKSLRTNKEFEVFKGSKVSIKLYKQFEGKKSFEGVLLNRDELNTIIEIEGQQKSFENKEISKITRFFEF